ncbi:hypothetical protein ACFE04_001083 [Oxalis oulophora]
MELINASCPNYLPVGFRFHPTDQELILHYLKNKISSTSSNNSAVSIIADVDIYKFNPWDLPGKATFGENEWFFYSPRERKYPNGGRPNRTAGCGYWKATGIDKPILSYGKQCVGVKKALVFNNGRPPKGIKTSWTMLEYRLPAGRTSLILNNRLRGSMRLDDWVLCRVRQKSRNSTEIAGNSFTTSDVVSSPIPPRNLVTNNNIINNNNNSYMDVYNYQLQASFMTFLDNNEPGDEQASEIIPDGNIASSSNMGSAIPTVCSISDALNSINRVLSIGGMDELSSIKYSKDEIK